MGKREAANDPDPERIPTDEEFEQWLQEQRERRNREAALPPGFHEINLEGGFPPIPGGRWLLQYFDSERGLRYSIGCSLDRQFFLLCLHDSDRHTTLDWFPDLKTIFLSLNVPRNEWLNIAPFSNRE